MEDTLWAYILDFKGNWDERLHLDEFAYINSFQESIGMAPSKALYGRTSRTLVRWDEVSKKTLIGLELVHMSTDAVKVIPESL